MTVDDLKPLSIDEVVQLLTPKGADKPPVGAETIKRYLNQGRWQGVKLGHTWMMTRADVQHALDVQHNELRPPKPAPASGVSPRARRKRIA